MGQNKANLNRPSVRERFREIERKLNQTNMGKHPWNRPRLERVDSEDGEIYYQIVIPVHDAEGTHLATYRLTSDSDLSAPNLRRDVEYLATVTDDVQWLLSLVYELIGILGMADRVRDVLKGGHL